MFARPALLLVASSLYLAAAPPWFRIASPNFELFTAAGEKGGRQLLDRLETVRYVFRESIGGKSPSLPVRVFQFASEREFRRFEERDAVWGFHQGSAERDYIAVFGSGEQTLRAARHEYMHILLNHGSATLPMWLEEGTAELYSTVDMRGGAAVFGSPVVNHVQALTRFAWIPDERFFGTGKDSSFLTHTTLAGIFYAQSWALTHMLNFSPSWRKNMPAFVEAIDRGTPALLAFEPAFGASPSQALMELRNYIGAARFATALVPMPSKPVESIPVAEPLREDEILVPQVELFLALSKPSAARKMLASFKGEPTAAIETARGLEALAIKDTPRAKEHFLAAMKLGDSTAVPAFEYAMLLRDEQAPEAEVGRRLSEITGRHPDFAEAHFILGLMAQRENRHRDAVASFEEALRVLPRQSSFWHARAISHLELKQPELARRAVLRAAASASTPAQLEMAQTAMKLLIAKAPTLTGSPKPAVVIPDSWKPRQGAASVEGVLEQIDCYGPSARFHVRPSTGPSVRLWVDNPGEVLLKDASSLTFTFACGPQKPKKLTIEYDPQPASPQSTTGRITAIHFQ